MTDRAKQARAAALEQELKTLREALKLCEFFLRDIDPSKSAHDAWKAARAALAKGSE